MKLAELLTGIEHTATDAAAGDAEITGLSLDSRHVRPGSLFIAIRGERQDGGQFLADAVQRGAVAVVADGDVPPHPGVRRVRVPDARAAAAILACRYFGNPSDRLQVMGVTGTNGKTTVAFTVRDFLQAAGRRPGLIGTVQYEIGERVIPAARTTPDAVELQCLMAKMLKAGCQSVAMEVSSHSLVQKRTAGVAFDVAAFTNLTRDHLDYHHTVEEYYAAKRLLFVGLGLSKPATAVLNADDRWGRQLAADPEVRAARVTFGLAGDAAVRAADVRMGVGGSEFRVITPWGEAVAKTRLLGRFNVSNALAALACGGALGVPFETMVAALSALRRVPGRMEEIPTGRGFQVFVDYAHTDDALENVLRTVREIASKRIILVFGCGGNRDRTKRPAMGAVAGRWADYTVLTSDNPRREEPAAILAEIRAGFGAGANLETIEDRAQAIERALSLAREGDIVLVAGKGHEAYQEFANTTVPFDDRQVVRKVLGTA